ncbi:hypothetical protein JCM3766R1_001903 [Sporobolomyces carnicolor]
MTVDFVEFQRDVRSIRTTIRDPPEWITLKLSLVALTPTEHVEVSNAVETFDLQVESLSRMIKAYEDGAGDANHLRIAITGLAEGMRRVCEAVCPTTWNRVWKANFEAIKAERNVPPSRFDVTSRQQQQRPAREGPSLSVSTGNQSLVASSTGQKSF